MVVRRALRYAQGLAGLRGDDVILASFPRSGNTWLRFVLRNYLERMEGAGSAVDFERVDAVMPELGADDLRRPWPYRALPRFVKTHQRWLPFFRQQRAVLLLRDPRDVMVSYFHYEQSKLRPRFTGSFAGFIRHRRFGLRAWFAHARSWLGRAPVVARYEDLRANDVATCARLFTSLAIPYDTDGLREAVERSRFEEIRKVEKERGPDKPGMARFRAGAQFARKGVTGGWTEHFDPADVAYYEAHLRRYPDVAAALQASS